jgi:hypothetical protein
MYIFKCWWNTFCGEALIGVRWHRWRARPRWSTSWWRCTLAFVPPECLWIVYGAIGAWKPAVCLIFANHSRVSFGCRLHQVIPVILSTRFVASQISARCFLISCCLSFIATRHYPPMAIWAILHTRHMSDSSSCNLPPCLAIVPDMFKIYKKSVAASTVISGEYLNVIQRNSLR